MKILFIILQVIAFLVISNPVESQNTIFLKEGHIEFERKTNAFALMKEIGKDGAVPAQRVEDYIKNNPQFKNDLFDLFYKEGEWIYKPRNENAETPASMDEWFSIVANDNVIFSDINKKQIVSQKSVFGNLFLVKDTIKKIRWKLTSEIREIAGFQCKRANAIIMDSIYVVAFYTDEILSFGGPESFSGLPGMILGVAVPNMHLSWFATKVSAEAIADDEFIPPSKGKNVNENEFKTDLITITKNWNAAGLEILKKALL